MLIPSRLLKNVMSNDYFSRFSFSIFVAFLLFGQVFFSTLAYLLGVENRYMILPYRFVVASYSAYIVFRGFRDGKNIFLKAFPLCLAGFWICYFAILLSNIYFSGVTAYLPVWEFFAWGVGGCFLPSLACYIVGSKSKPGKHRQDWNSLVIASLGFLLLGFSSVFFASSASVGIHRFQLPSLNPINASHSFFVLASLALSCLINRLRFGLISLSMLCVSIFAVLMGAYAGSRGAALAFACSSFALIFLPRSISGIHKLLILISLSFSLAIIFAFNPSDLLDRFASAGSDMSSVWRLRAIMESLKVFLAHPLTGVGFIHHLNLFSFSDHNIWYPHNLIVESLALGGLLLAFPLVLCIYLSIRSCAGVFSDPTFELWRIALLIQSLGFIAFSGHLSNVPMFWIALGLSSSASSIRVAKMNL